MDNQIKNFPENETPSAEDAVTTPPADQTQIDSLNELQEDIIRNDTIPETSRTTPGSNGAFPVGAFENNKD